MLQEVNVDEVVLDDAAQNPPEPFEVNIKSLQCLVDKDMVYFGKIHFDRISGNNLQIVRESGVKIIKDSIVNSGWDDSTVFIIMW